ELVLFVLGVITSVLYVQAHNPRMMIADKRNRIVSCCIEVADIQIDAQVVRGALKSVHEIFRCFKLLRPVSLKTRIAEPMIMKSQLDFVFLAPLTKPRYDRFLDRCSPCSRSQQQGAVESAIEIIVL